jgi:hypothetical protein
MRSRLIIVSTISVICLFASQSASAQPRWGRDRLPNQGACFYEDVNFRGSYFCVRQGDRLASLPRGFNDRISSIRSSGPRCASFKIETSAAGRRRSGATRQTSAAAGATRCRRSGSFR